MIYVKCRHCYIQLVVGTWHFCEKMPSNGLREEVRVSLEQHPNIFASLKEVKENKDWRVKPEKPEVQNEEEVST